MYHEAGKFLSSKSVYCGVQLVVTVLKNPKRSLHRQQMLSVLRNESTYCFQNSVCNNNHVLLEYSLSSVLVGNLCTRNE